MDLSTRSQLVEILENKGEQDEYFNPILSVVGSFYADAKFPTPKDAISTGQMAVVQYVQLVFLASDARRLGIKSSMKARINGEFYEINTLPFQVYQYNKLYVGMNVSRKANNG